MYVITYICSYIQSSYFAGRETMSDTLAVNTVNLTKIYRMGPFEFPALKDVNLQVRRGEFCSIVGPSGSGKSTLLNMIGALDRPTSGHVYIGGVDIAGLNESQLADLRNQKIGFIFQAHNLIMRTSALRNVELPLTVRGIPKNERIRKASELLATVGLGNKINRRPAVMSGGEQQRVAVARALINEPTIILGDEPTGNLDSKTGAEVVDLMKRMNETLGITFILVTHNPEVANVTDRIIHLRDGQIHHEETVP